MTLRNQSQETLPDIAMLNQASFEKHFRKEYGAFLESMGLDENDPRAREELLVRTEVERLCKEITLILSQEEGSTEQLKENWTRITQLMEEHIVRRKDMIEAKLRDQLGTKKVSENMTSAEFLSQEIDAAYSGDEHEAIREKLDAIAQGFDKDGAPGGKYVFYYPDGIDFHAVASAEVEVEGILRSPVTSTKKQKDAAGNLLNSLRTLGNLDPRYQGMKEAKHWKVNKKSGELTGIFRLGVATAAAALALWSLKSKNTPLFVVYAGISLLAFKPDFFKGADYHQMKRLQYLQGPRVQRLLARYPQNWKGALNNLFGIINDGPEEQKSLLQKLARNPGGVSMIQARELLGTTNDALLGKLSEAKDDTERREMLRVFCRVEEQDLQNITLQYVESVEGLRHT